MPSYPLMPMPMGPMTMVPAMNPMGAPMLPQPLLVPMAYGAPGPQRSSGCHPAYKIIPAVVVTLAAGVFIGWKGRDYFEQGKLFAKKKAREVLGD